jgi:hypothetical protein
MSTERTINAATWIEKYVGEPKEQFGEAYTFSKTALTKLLQVYGKELLIEAAERAQLVVVNNEEYIAGDEEDPDTLEEYECGSDTVIVYKKSITSLIDEL